MDKRPDEVATMFDDVAPKYDVVNDVLSMGQTRRWRRVVVEAMDMRAGQRVLDLAAGTGTSSEPYADAGIDVIACDFALGMLKVGKRRRPDLGFIAGDATRLPFAGPELRHSGGEVADAGVFPAPVGTLLAAATGMTVRTTRYYAGLGLIPPPSRPR